MTDNQKHIIHRMRSDGASYKRITEFLGISENTVKSFCRRNGLGNSVTQKPVEVPEDENHCKQCGKHLVQVPKQKPKKFCSQECRFAWWNTNRDKIARKAVYEFKCKCCGIPFKSYGNKSRVYCCHRCYITDRFK